MKKLSEMPQVALTDILTEQQLKAMETVLAELHKEGLDPMDPKFTGGLKTLFREWKDDLEKKGVLPDYLAYVIAFMISQGERR